MEVRYEVTEYMDKFRDPKQVPESKLDWWVQIKERSY